LLLVDGNAYGFHAEPPRNVTWQKKKNRLQKSSMNQTYQTCILVMIAVAFTLWAQYFDGRHVAFLGCNLGILLCLGTMARFADGEG
jgi:hypothetical protein